MSKTKDLGVTGISVQYKSSYILETMQDRDNVTTDH